MQIILSLLLLAQFETGSIVGTVRDTTGAVVPGTTVTLTNTATAVAVTRTTGPRSRPCAQRNGWRSEFRQFRDLGVDGIFTDFPDAAVRALR